MGVEVLVDVFLVGVDVRVLFLLIVLELFLEPRFVELLPFNVEFRPLIDELLPFTDELLPLAVEFLPPSEYLLQIEYLPPEFA